MSLNHYHFSSTSKGIIKWGNKTNWITNTHRLIYLRTYFKIFLNLRLENFIFVVRIIFLDLIQYLMGGAYFLNNFFKAFILLISSTIDMPSLPIIANYNFCRWVIDGQKLWGSINRKSILSHHVDKSDSLLNLIKATSKEIRLYFSFSSYSDSS